MSAQWLHLSTGGEQREAEREQGAAEMERERPYLRPGWLLSRVINPILIRLRLLPALVVRGRWTGQWRRVPVNVLELGGERYLVAPRGNTQLTRNLRAAGEG